MIAKKVFYLLSLIFLSCFLQGIGYSLGDITNKTISHIENDQVFIFNKKPKSKKDDIFDLSLNVFDLNKKKIIISNYPLDKEVFKFGFSNNKNFVVLESSYLHDDSPKEINVFDLNRKKFLNSNYPLDKEVFKFGFSNYVIKLNSNRTSLFFYYLNKVKVLNLNTHQLKVFDLLNVAKDITNYYLANHSVFKINNENLFFVYKNTISIFNEKTGKISSKINLNIKYTSVVDPFYGKNKSIIVPNEVVDIDSNKKNSIFFILYKDNQFCIKNLKNKESCFKFIKGKDYNKIKYNEKYNLVSFYSLNSTKPLLLYKINTKELITLIKDSFYLDAFEFSNDDSKAIFLEEQNFVYTYDIKSKKIEKITLNPKVKSKKGIKINLFSPEFAWLNAIPLKPKPSKKNNLDF